MDAQGADRARPYVERAAATFTTLVDSEDLLGHLLGFKAIPNGFLIDESGVVRYRKVGGFDIRKQETAEIVRRWAAGSNLEEIAPEPFRSPQGTANSRSESLFRDGLALYRSGRRDEGMAMWRDALAFSTPTTTLFANRSGPWRTLTGSTRATSTTAGRRSRWPKRG